MPSGEQNESTDSYHSEEELRGAFGRGGPTDRSASKMKILKKYFARNELKLCYGQPIMMFADKLKFTENSLFSDPEGLLDDEEDRLSYNNGEGEFKIMSTMALRKKERYALHFHDYLNRSVQYAPYSQAEDRGDFNSGNFLFCLLPVMVFNSRKRVETQVSRIQEFLKQMISSRRIDDEDSIERNVAQLMSEIHDNIAKLAHSQKTNIKYGDKLMIVHISSGLFLKVEPRP